MMISRRIEKFPRPWPLGKAREARNVTGADSVDKDRGAYVSQAEAPAHEKGPDQ
jgi:hypothetical protein